MSSNSRSRLDRLEKMLANRAFVPSQQACKASLAKSLYGDEGQDGGDELWLDMALRLVSAGLFPAEPLPLARYPIPTKGTSLIPTSDPRYEAGAVNKPITLPLCDTGDELLIYGERRPANLQEAYWLAGTTGPVYYTCKIGDETKAIHVDGPIVSARGFGSAWVEVGQIDTGREST